MGMKGGWVAKWEVEGVVNRVVVMDSNWGVLAKGGETRKGRNGC